MKKFVALFLILAMVAAPTAFAAELTENGTYPIVSSEATLDIMVNDKTENGIEANLFTEYMEEKTGVKINWRTVNSETVSTKVTLAFTGNDMPDAFMNCNISLSAQMLYAEQGLIQPLNDAIASNGSHIQVFFDEHPWVVSSITHGNGNIYDIPKFSDTYHMTHNQKMWVYKPWLDALELDIPKTTEEFREMLEAFKEGDPNNNGEADEIPVSFIGVSPANHQNILAYMMSSFIPADLNEATDNYLMTLNDGVISPVFTTDAWRDGLTYIRGLYKDGLIDVDSITQDNSQWRAKLADPEKVFVGAYAQHANNAMAGLAEDPDRWAEYVVIPPLVGPDGVQTTMTNMYGRLSTGLFVVTSACEDVNLAVRWADTLFDDEVMYRMVYGIEGQDWEYVEEGVGLDGGEAIWNWMGGNGSYVNSAKESWPYMTPYYTSAAWRNGQLYDPEAGPNLEAILIDATNQYAPYAVAMENIVPILIYDEEDSLEFADLKLTIESYVMECASRFILGEMDLENDWGTYIDTLNAMQLDRLIELKQAAYDAKYGE